MIMCRRMVDHAQDANVISVMRSDKLKGEANFPSASFIQMPKEISHRKKVYS